MKSIYLSLIALMTLAPIANAAPKKKVTVETLITCQQEEGDQYIEIGIALNDGPGLRALVVENNVDDDSSRLIADLKVSESKQGRNKVYADLLKTIQLTISKKSGNTFGKLTLLQDGPGSISQDGLYCYEKSDITFDKK